MKKLIKMREFAEAYRHLYSRDGARWMMVHPRRSGLEPAIVHIAGQQYIDRDILNYLIYSQDSFALTGE